MVCINENDCFIELIKMVVLLLCMSTIIG